MDQDWRVFLSEYESRFPGEVFHVDDELDPRYEPTAVILELERARRHPVVRFHGIAGSDFPVIANVLATRARLALALGVSEVDLSSVFAERINRRIPPIRTAEPPFHANRLSGAELDLYRLPILTHFPIDAGPYITGGLVTARDPVTGADTFGYHRMQLKARDRLGISLHSRQRLWEYHRRAEERGVNLEAAVVLGVHPAVSLGSMALVPYHEGKFERVGGLLQEPLCLAPCSSIDVEVPAWAEVVIEGEILAQVREPEGPFAEFTNYCCHRSTENVFVPKVVHYRDHASYQCITPGLCAEHITIVAVQREGDVLRALRASLPNVVNVHAPVSACGLFHCYISLRKTAEGQPLQAVLGALAVDHNLKLVIVVDDDVDVLDETQVLWAVATRVQADRDVVILPGHLGMGCTLDPSSDDLSRSAKMGIDATRPLAGFADRVTVHEEAMNKARALIQAWERKR